MRGTLPTLRRAPLEAGHPPGGYAIVTRRASGRQRMANVFASPTGSPSSKTGLRRSSSTVQAAVRRCSIRGCGQVLPVGSRDRMGRRSSSRSRASKQSRTTVVGMAPWGDVPVAEPLSVGGDDRPAGPHTVDARRGGRRSSGSGRRAGPRRGHGERRRRRPGESARVGRRPAEGAAEVTAEEADGRGGLDDWRRASSIAARTSASDRQTTPPAASPTPGSPYGVPFVDHAHRRSGRCRHDRGGRDDAAEAPIGCFGACRSGRRFRSRSRASWRSRSISCLTLRTKSPAGSSSSSRSDARLRPSTQAWA